MFNPSRLTVSLLFLCLLVFPVPAQKNASESPQKIIFVLDASGSMWGKVGGEDKIVIAKRVLKMAIGKLPDTAHVGLIAYGHRRKSDCNDIETLSALKPINKAGLAGQIDALDAQGMTPITNSLQKAIDEVKAQKISDTVKIVLVSDGLETCKGDPCKLVRDAKKAGVNITVHVIGFDVGKVIVSQLECIAQAGDGIYTDAQSADELASALTEAVSTEVEEFNSRLSVKAIADGKLTDAVVLVSRIGSTEAVNSGRTYDSTETNPRILPLPAGTYNVTVRAVNLSGSPWRKLENVKIAEGETVEKTVDFSAGGLEIEVTRNGKLSDAVIQVFAVGQIQSITGGRTYVAASTNPLVMRLAPGKYDVVIKSNEIAGSPETRLKGVAIGRDMVAILKHNFQSGTLRIGSTRGGQLIDTTVTIFNLDTKKDVAGVRTYADAKTNPRTFELEAGRYRVRLSAVSTSSSSPKEIIITVKAGEIIERSIDFAR